MSEAKAFHTPSEHSKEDAVLETINAVPNGLSTIEEQQERRNLFTYSEGQKILRKVDMRLMPFLLLTYLLRGMDGGAISYVKTMNPKSPTNILNQLHMTTNQYGYASTTFTLFYALGELPSNLLFKKTTPRWHYMRIVALWSIAAICHAAAFNAAGLLTARAFLGLFEAGMAPGAYLHLTYYYRPDEIGPRIAAISAMFNFCNIFVALETYGLSYVDGHGGLGGWQWTYIINGLLGIVLLVILYFWMPDFPEDCKWLTPEEQQWIVGRLPAGSSRANDRNFDVQELKDAFKSLTNLTFATMVVIYNTGALGMTFWLPTIIANLGFSTTASAQLLNIPPAALYWIGGIGGNILTDRMTMIPRPVILCTTLTLVTGGMFALAYVRSIGALYAIICIMQVFASWSYQTFIPWRCQSLKGTTDAAFAMAWLTGAGQVAGLWSAQIFQSKYAPRYTTPFIVCAALTIGAGLMVLVNWWRTYNSEKETRRIMALRRKVGKENDEVLQEDVNLGAEVAQRNNRNEATSA
ncbi:hypothetical protein I317_06825 [Kwoniella heveanensis CBS 569]|uniref:Major facilitator superfamily (MFS) profile domain-containing protein n=1 Tax=Kwoniella heveanensis BCC8398 TaxID=1296120 RepID=A0A1B9GN40_9TREE|nr:hypothetical protein I316_05927 [Kwoniella heveanensis BCC8398]OCF39397.1 hypothetical protein I317_06825 [Kwoniella heveanensis CBS 569]